MINDERGGERQAINDWLLVVDEQYELLFCICDESDPSLMLVKRLMDKYPNVDASVFIGKPSVQRLVDLNAKSITNWLIGCMHQPTTNNTNRWRSGGRQPKD